MYLVSAITENIPNQIMEIGSEDKGPKDVLFPENFSEVELKAPGFQPTVFLTGRPKNWLLSV